MEMTVWPSVPAVRAPLLPRTRSQPTKRKAGSHTRLNRSSNRRPELSAAQRCSLVWISSTRRSARSRANSSSSIFTDALLAFQHPSCGPTGLLRHAGGFPALGLLRDLRPAPRPSAGDEPALVSVWRTEARAAVGGSHVHCTTDRRGRRPA